MYAEIRKSVANTATDNQNMKCKITICIPVLSNAKYRKKACIVSKYIYNLFQKQVLSAGKRRNLKRFY